MKRKIKCISMIGLLLLTGVASFSVSANQMEKNTPVVKFQSGTALITVTGGYKITIKIKEIDANYINNGYYYRFRIQFGNGQALCGSIYIDNSKEQYSTSSLFYYRLRLPEVLSGRTGTVTVHVEIGQNNAVPDQKYDEEGTFRGSRVFI
jgi:hypothetical protein